MRSFFRVLFRGSLALIAILAGAAAVFACIFLVALLIKLSPWYVWLPVAFFAAAMGIGSFMNEEKE